MMRKSVVHKDKYANKCEITQSHSNDGTAARTRPFSFDEIMLRRKNKKQSGSVEDQRGGSEVVSGKGVEGVSGRVESDRHRHNEGVFGRVEPDRHKHSEGVFGRVEPDRHRHSEGVFGRVEPDRHRHNDGVGSEQHASKESLKVSSRTKEDKSKMREGKMIESEHKESNSYKIKSKVSSDDANDRRKERGAHDKRKNHDRLSDGADYEYGKRHGKDSAIKDGGNRGKSEHASKRRNQNGYDERTRDQDAAKKHESSKWHDSDTSERKQKKETSESRHGYVKLKSKRSRSREHDRDKSRRSNSPSPRGHKQRLYDGREHEELSSHSSKDRIGRFDSNIDRKRVSNNGSNNKSKRHDSSASKLGGYSPRKRRSEAAVKTPSPTDRSPEKKNARTESKFPTSLQSDLPSLKKTEFVVPLNSSILKPTVGVLLNIPSMINTSVDSIQLTQATRPKRRLYVENLPSSASEAAVVEWLNGYLRPSGFNHVQGMSPCISCIVNKEKGQALVEFLTPEDASTALSFDGKSFSGNILKIRRPRDYVDATTGVSEKPVAAAVSVKNDVQDSPNKIFIGGISKVITSEMLMEVASAFGPLKAYHFEVNADLDGHCAFVEYADQSVTVKACAGLNGLKLGGQVLTVTRAIPDGSSVENLGGEPFYGIPAHACPLLEKPTQVLKLNNVLDPHILPSLSEPELEEILEDVRLECARFGMVKSINIIKHTNRPTSPETGKVDDEADSMGEEVTNERFRERGSEPSDTTDKEPEEVNGINDDEHEKNKIVKDETRDTVLSDDVDLENKSLKVEIDEVCDDLTDGCVLVEYKRVEASSMAAHCLHGRIFDGRIVRVGYVALDVYCARFRK